MQSFSLSHTSLVSILFSIFMSFPFFLRSLFLFLSLLNAFSKTKGLRLSLFFFSKALSKVLCVDSLRYLQERLALQHLLPAVPSRCTTMREDSGASYSRSLGYRVADHLSASRQSRISMRLALLAAWTHSISYAFVRVLLTVLFGANRIRYRRGTLSPLTPRG